MGQLRLWSAFLAGCTAGGALTGALVGVLSGLVSPVPLPVRLAVFGALAAALLLLDLVSRTLALPQRTELIPQDVFGRGMARGAARFGAEYGSGVRTLIPSAASYIAAAFVLLANPAFGWCVLLGVAFGASRSVGILQHIVLGRPGWQDFLVRHARLLERLGSVVSAVLLGAAAWRIAG